MGLIARVLSFARVTRNGAPVNTISIDPGGGPNVTADIYAPAGLDSQPLTDDLAAAVDTRGTGRAAIVGYNDSRNASKSDAGETRLYARDALGNVVAEVWAKNTGEIIISNLLGAITIAADGTVTINGVTISTAGIVSASNVVAGVGPATVSLLTHQHPTAAPGPPSPPIPGT